MATIAQIVAQIRTAIFGRDVRENIAQGIEKCYDDVTTGATVADAAAENANTKAGLADDAATLANTKAGLADAAATAANTAATAAENVNASVSKSGNTVTFSVTNRNGVTSSEDLSMEGSIDDTKGIGDTDYVWSADQNEKLYEIQDDRTNELYGYVNYGYDEYDQINATSSYAYSCKRNKTIYTLNGTNGSNYDGRIKINNNMAREVTSNGVKALTGGTTLIAGHKYAVKLKKISGSYTYNTSPLPNVSVYRKGESSTVGDTTIKPNGERIRTFVAEENIEYMICIYFPQDSTAENFVCSITLEDITKKTISDCPVTKAPVISKTIDFSSDTISFNDAADDMQMSVKVGINATQDLHGYDKPWAGGNGKNLLYAKNWDETITSVTYAQDGSGMIDCSGTSSSASWYRIDRGAQSGQQPLVLPSGSYIASATGLITNTYIRVTDSTGTERDITPSATSQIITSDGTNAISLNMRTQSGVEFGTSTKIYCMIRSASVSDDTWEPYENICPIIGQTETTIVHGSNLYDEDAADWVNGYTINDSGSIVGITNYRYSNTFYPVKGGIDVTIQCTVTEVTTTASLLVQYTADNVFIGRIVFAPVSTKAGFKCVTFKTDPTCAYFRVITPKVPNLTEIMVFYGTEPETYKPYIKNVYNVTFPTSAGTDGTVYGGTLTVNGDGTGLLEVTHIRSLLSSWTWTYASSYGFRTGNNNATIKKAGGGQLYGDAYCSAYQVVSSSKAADFRELNGVIAFGCNSITNYMIIVQDHRFNGDATAFKNAMGDTEMVFELTDTAKAERIYLLSASEVRTFFETNYFSCSTGDVLSVKYPVDSKKYIDSTRPIISGSDTITATSSHPVGEVFICNNKLYMATSVIAVGDAIEEGTNVTSTIMIGSEQVPLNLTNYIKSVMTELNNAETDIDYLKARSTNPDEALTKNIYIQNGELTYSNRTVKIDSGIINFSVPNSSGSNYRSIWFTGTALAGGSDNFARSIPEINNVVSISTIASANTVRVHYDNVSGTGIIYVGIAYCIINEETVTLVGDKQQFASDVASDYVANLVIPEAATHYAIQIYQTTPEACEWNIYLQFQKNV